MCWVKDMGKLKRTISAFLACFLLVACICNPVYAAEEATEYENDGFVEAGLENFVEVNTYRDGQFVDVGPTMWFEDNVKSAFQFGLMKGKSATAFSPSGNITVAETITLAARLYSIYYSGTEEFVQGEVWYQVYVDYCIAYGIIEESQFSAYTVPATRAQFAQILGASLPNEALAVQNWIEDGAIPDVPMDANGADAIYRLYRAGVLTGSDSQGSFNPDSTITRAQAAAIITRMVDPSLRKSIQLNGEY